MNLIKKGIKRALAAITVWLEIPGELYLADRYRYVRGMHIFPSQNIHLLTVGRDVSLHNVLVNLWAPVIIEDRVSIAHNASLITGGHEISNEGVRETVKPRGGIIIRAGAWIGSGAIVLGGVTIGRASVVAAGSVVTTSVPDSEIWGGNPAKFLRRLPD